MSAPMNGSEETALIRRCQTGDENAFRELIRTHMEHAIQIAYNACGNYEDARDIAQDAFVKVHKSLSKFDGKSKFMTWFYRILMNTAKDFHRRKKWKKFVTWKNADEQQKFTDTLEDKTSASDSASMESELNEQMQKAVCALPEKQRWIFTLRFIENLSLKEISEITGLSSGTVKSSLHFASAKFKQAMKPYLES